MKILAMSDNHSSFADCIEIIAKFHSTVDLFVHLGDGADSFEEAADVYDVKYYSVRGNCDLGNQPEELVFEAENKKFYACHGHYFKVGFSKIEYKKFIEENKYDVGLFGHTHVPYLEEFAGRYIINPGSVSRSRSGDNSFCIIEIDGNNLKADFYSSKSLEKIILPV